jgi:uncharacterized membrane protein YuzA (DUF378 family)
LSSGAVLKTLLLYSLLIVCGFLTAVVLGFIGRNQGWFRLRPSEETPVDMVTILLGSATLVMAVVGIIVGIAAVVGFAYLKDIAQEAGSTAGKRVAQDLLDKRLAGISQISGLRDEDRTEALVEALTEGNTDGQ